MWCDRRTFTETNGNIVSGKADRAVNQGSNTEQINISRNSSVFFTALPSRAANASNLVRSLMKLQMCDCERLLLWHGFVLDLWPELHHFLRCCCWMYLSLQLHCHPSEFSCTEYLCHRKQRLRRQFQWEGPPTPPASSPMWPIVDSGQARSTSQTHDRDEKLSN